MSDKISLRSDDRPVPAGPLAGALGLALLGAALLRFLSKRRGR
ncbi:MAG: hypothetical protein WCB04_13240 [Mycobacteriales bacterium]